jgi:hypothetical protein
MEADTKEIVSVWAESLAAQRPVEEEKVSLLLQLCTQQGQADGAKPEPGAPGPPSPRLGSPLSAPC